MAVYRYKVPPKSSPMWQRNLERHGETGCAICGKPVKGEPGANTHEGHVLDTRNGWMWAPDGWDEMTDEDRSKYGDVDDYGWWPIGPDCHMRNVIKKGEVN